MYVNEQHTVPRRDRARFGGLTLKELALRVWREANDDDVWADGASLAFFFMLALFPMLIFVTSLLAFLPGAQQALIDSVARVVPNDAMGPVYQFLRDVVDKRSSTLLSLSALGTIWAASTGVSSLFDTLNHALDIKETRPYWKVRSLSVAVTLGLAILVAGGLVLTLWAGKLGFWLTTRLGLADDFRAISSFGSYILGVFFLLIAIDLVYFFGPNLERRWRLLTPGAVFAVFAIILGSFGLSVYLRVAPAYSITYGSLGAVVTLMLWLYLLGLALLIGAEINSQIEKAGGPASDLKA
jgi:membrane protein